MVFAAAAALCAGPLFAQGPRAMSRYLTIQGKVVFEDGSPAPADVVVIGCAGGATTKPGGTFSFTAGAGRGEGILSVPVINEDLRSMSDEQSLMGCAVRASLPGYSSSVSSLPQTQGVVTVKDIVLRKLVGVEGSTVSMNSLSAPPKARQAFESGLKEAEKKRWDRARKSFEKALASYPDYADAWSALGTAFREEGDMTKAREAYAKACAADPKYVQPHLGLAVIALREQNWQEVIAQTEKVLDLNPVEVPEAWLYHATAKLSLRDPAAAIKSAQHVLDIDIEHNIPKAEHVMGVALAQTGNYEKAVQHLRNYLTHAPDAPDADAVRQQMAMVEKAMSQQ